MIPIPWRRGIPEILDDMGQATELLICMDFEGKPIFYTGHYDRDVEGGWSTDDFEAIENVIGWIPLSELSSP